MSDKPYSLHDLACDLEFLAGRIRAMDPAQFLRVLEYAELEEGFEPTVRSLVSYTQPPSAEQLAQREHVDEIIRRSQDPHDWPPVAADTFAVTVDVDSPAEPDGWGDLVLLVGEQEIYRRATWFEATGHLGHACRELREAYKGRVKSYQLTDTAKNSLYGDDFDAPGKVRKAFRGVMKDFQSAQRARNTTDQM